MTEKINFREYLRTLQPAERLAEIDKAETQLDNERYQLYKQEQELEHMMNFLNNFDREIVAMYEHLTALTDYVTNRRYHPCYICEVALDAQKTLKTIYPYIYPRKRSE